LNFKLAERIAKLNTQNYQTRLPCQSAAAMLGA